MKFSMAWTKFLHHIVIMLLLSSFIRSYIFTLKVNQQEYGPAKKKCENPNSLADRFA